MSAQETLPPDAAPTAADVVAAYFWVLGRPPENERVVGWHVANVETVEMLRRRLMGSAEFREKHGFAGSPILAGGPVPAIGLEATPAEIARMLVLAQRYWQHMGEVAPHWSALPEPIFRPEHIASSRRSLFASGREDRDLLEGILRQVGIPLNRIGHVVDFGCGIGRATLHFAALAAEVTGVDFAAAQLAIARQEAQVRGLDHIAWVRVQGGATMPQRGCDVWFSRRVLQHNPPPVIRALLRRTFADLRPGAVAVFQLLSWGADYGFSVAEALAAPSLRGLPQHVLPQAEVFALAREAGLELVAVHEDPVPGLDRTRWLSHVFVVRCPG
jgi:SAM-dependent methyltransferase